MKTILFVLLTLVLDSKNVEGQFASRLLPPTEAASISFGDAVAYDPVDHWVMVSRQNEWVTVGEQVGAVYVYRNENANWEFKQRLVAASLEIHMSFGFSMALRGNVLLIGSSEGMHIFRKNQNDEWLEETLIANSQRARNASNRPFDFISDNLVAFKSSIYEYRNGSWSAVHSLRPDGINVSASGDFVWLQEGLGQEIKYVVYESDGTTWSESMEIDSYGGYDLALNSEWAAHHYIENGASRIRTYQFNNEEWQFHSDIIHPDRTAFFGLKIALDGGRLLVADPRFEARSLGLNIVGGIVYLYEYSHSRNQWELIEEYRGIADEELFGGSLALSGDGIVVGTTMAAHVIESPPISTSGEESELDFELEISAFPNPFTDRFRIEIRFPDYGHFKVGLYDLHGRIVQILSDDYGVQDNHRVIDFESSELASGVYLLRVDLEGRSASRLLTKR